LAHHHPAQRIHHLLGTLGLDAQTRTESIEINRAAWRFKDGMGELTFLVEFEGIVNRSTRLLLDLLMKRDEGIALSIESVEFVIQL